ncbi:MAG TPA: hypothetical protein VEK15_22790 [Vicinamibacteria bacterium]|nr:hypothetical protein [Vicinamibacteria bacterium]
MKTTNQLSSFRIIGRGTRLVFSLALLLVIALPRTSPAQGESDWRLVRTVGEEELAGSKVAGSAFSPRGNTFFMVRAGESDSRSAVSDILTFSSTGERRDLLRFADRIDPINVAVDGRASRMLAYLSGGRQWIELSIRADGTLDRDSARRSDATALGVEDARGLAVDAHTGDIYLLDATRARIVRARRFADGSLEFSAISEIDLGRAGLDDARGLAVDPESGNLHVASISRQRMFELSASGRVVAYRDISSLRLSAIHGLSFAPSGDTTDDPSRMSLYVSASSSGRAGEEIFELSFHPAPPAMLPSTTATLVQTIDTSQFGPPSPDPSGLAYYDGSGNLFIADSEVNEMAIYADANVFEATTAGSLVDTFNTLSFSDEPTGVTYNPDTGHLFFTDDNLVQVWELAPGTDGMFGTVDDIVAGDFDTGVFGSNDPEGIAYDTTQGVLFVADSLSSEIYRVSPGVNGLFDGVPAVGGDDVVTSFDTEVFGITVPEGIAFDHLRNHLYIVGEPEHLVAQVTVDGTLLRMIDISSAVPNRPSGLVYAPSSQDALIFNLYVADRGVDNNVNPNENDGKIFEMSLPPLTPGNNPPSVSAGPDQAVTLAASALLNGTVSDDGLPSPPTLVTFWTLLSGPGLAVLDDPAAVDTLVSFFEPGTYTFRLTAHDGQLVASDEVTLTVTGTVDTSVANSQVAALSDDAEELVEGGFVTLNSADLQMTSAQAFVQVVGLRFNGVTVPQGSKILGAYVQFHADEAHGGPTALVIEGQAADNAATFVLSNGNISQRPRTASAMSWSPPPWDTVGQAGAGERTPNLAPIIQEIVDRGGWTSGNSLALILSGTGLRTAVSFEGNPSQAPSLHINYLPPEFAGDATVSNDVVTTDRLVWACGTLSVGPDYTIMAPASVVFRAGHAVTLNDGVSVETGATLTVQLDLRCAVNQTPVVTIQNPTDGASFAVGANIQFTGAAVDAEEGNLAANLVWTSDVDGNIGTGASFSTSTLSLGFHSITASVMDSGGLIGSDAITIKVGNFAPTATITAPADGSFFNESDTILFTGTANDTEDGDLTASLGWTSSIDGLIGNGGSFSTSALSTGVHTVTASVTDSGGLDGTDQIIISVVPPGETPPVVTIASPGDGGYFNSGDMITFNGTAIDTQDGPISGNLSWSSNLDGDLGTGASFQLTTLSVGVHVVTATVEDSVLLTGEDHVVIIVGDTDPPVLVGAGDVSDCLDNDDEKTAQLLDSISGTVFTTGDNAFSTGSASEFTTCYDPVWGRHKSRTRPSIGTNEYNTPGATGYFNYFGAAAGEPATGYYSYELGAWHVIVLNSVCNRVGGCGLNSPQGLWLKDDLEANSNACTVAYWHHPRFSSGELVDRDSVLDFWRLLYDYGADVVVNGNDQIYERLAPQDPGGIADSTGIREFVVGTGGRFHAAFLDNQANSQVRDNTAYGVLKLTLNPASYDWEFVPEAGQAFTDSGNTACNPTTNRVPMVTITSPLDNSNFGFGVEVTFEGTAMDWLDGDLSSSIEWSSDLDGVLGMGSSLATSSLTVGTHTITATATDMRGGMGSHSITININ